MKNRQYLFILLLISSCIIDSFVPVFNIKNFSNKSIKIFFSNDSNIDKLQLGKAYAIVPPNESFSALKGSIIFSKKEYKHSDKQLYLFIFDNDTINKLAGKYNMDVIAKRSFLEKRIINIRKIKPTDTIFYRTNSR